MVLEKKDIILECEVAGKPPPRVTWLKNGDRIKQDEYLQFVNGWVINLSNLGILNKCVSFKNSRSVLVYCCEHILMRDLKYHKFVGKSLV